LSPYLTTVDILFLELENGILVTISEAFLIAVISLEHLLINFNRAISVAIPDSSGNKLADELIIKDWQNSS